MTEIEATGGCLCGDVRFQITAKPLATYSCHCTMCQKNGGGPFMAGATVPIEAFTYIKGKPLRYQSSPELVRLFCGACGSPVGYQAAENPKLADFPLGCLDDPNIIKPESHMFTSTQISWCELKDDLPRYAEGSPDVAKLWA
jgi:hypothetical protein